MVQTLGSRLVALGAGGAPTGHVVVDHTPLSIGRDPQSDLFLVDPGVSWHHAELTRADGRWLVRDCGSTNGTTVAGVRITQPTEIRDGAVIGIGPMRARFEVPLSPAAGPQTVPHPTPTSEPWPPGAGGSHDATVTAPPGMSLGVINGVEVNVAEGVQYIQRIQNVLHERRSFLRDVAGTRTWARWLAWTGLFLAVTGLGTVLVFQLRFLEAVFGAVSTGVPPDPTAIDVFGREAAGVPVFALGALAMFLGVLLLVVGIVLHVVATARLSKIEERHPIPRIGAHHH